MGKLLSKSYGNSYFIKGCLCGCPVQSAEDQRVCGESFVKLVKFVVRLQFDYVI